MHSETLKEAIRVIAQSIDQLALLSYSTEPISAGSGRALPCVAAASPPDMVGSSLLSEASPRVQACRRCHARKRKVRDSASGKVSDIADKSQCDRAYPRCSPCANADVHCEVHWKGSDPSLVA